MEKFEKIIDTVRDVYNEPSEFIPLHAPVFSGNEKKYVNQTIDSTFVSSVGEFVNQFERDIANFTGAKYGIALVNGTSALQIALTVSGVKQNDEVITQPLTFVATANAIVHCGAVPVFVDVDLDTLGMSPDSLETFLSENTLRDDDGNCINKNSGRKIAACVPMHTFGLACRIDRIFQICEKYGIALVEDSAESLGTTFRGKGTGTYGITGTLSFNGNKTITCGGGGAIITNDENIARRAKHITTTAKVPHQWEFVHDEIGFNYRMPNLNAALACAQLENLPLFLESKRYVHQRYFEIFNTIDGVTLIDELAGTNSNYWLNAIMFDDPEAKKQFLKFSNSNKIMTRPIWKLMNKLPMFSGCQTSQLVNSLYLEERIVNLPSSPLPNFRA